MNLCAWCFVNKLSFAKLILSMTDIPCSGQSRPGSVTGPQMSRAQWLGTLRRKAKTFLPCPISQYGALNIVCSVKPLIFILFLLKYTRIKIKVGDFPWQQNRTLPSTYSGHVLTGSFHFAFYRKGVFRKLCGLTSFEYKFSTSFIYA